ncbi:MAG TPA: D-alanyl-D-alanine carboxypeptidase/D-alanyl-D-alanine-endopeptidase [Tepidisphaeraceae bacterium]
MRQRSHCLILVLMMLLLAPSLTRADLSSDIRAVLGDKLLSRADVGVEIVRLGESVADDKPVFGYNATAPRVPASNLKLATTSTAIEKLGADFQFRTVLAGRGHDIALIGDGDPTLGDAEMLHKVGWDVDTVFKAWAQSLKQRGITEVNDVYVDDSIFDQNFLPVNWPPEQEHKRYVAQIGGVNLNANCVDFYLRTTGFGQLVEYRTNPVTQYIVIGNTCVTGSRNAIWLSRQRGTNDVVLRGETDVSNSEPVSVTIHDPPMFAATVLAETLRVCGIRVNGEVKRDRTIRGTLAGVSPATGPSDRWSTLAVHTTPLSAVLARANKDSMNLYAEALCKRIGAAVTGESGTWDNGTAAVGGFLESVGVSRQEFNLDDGCGLSKKNTISPNAIAKILGYEFHGKDHKTFVESLAVAGIDGTFKDRFQGSDLRGRVFGKSGYVVGVSACSGLLKAKDGQWYAFSILMNGLPEGTNGGAKQLQERIVKAVDAASSGGGGTGRVVDGR